MKPRLQPHLTSGARVDSSGSGLWRLTIPAGPAGRYRWAQLDDYDAIPRLRFPCRAPTRLELLARVSANGLAGTWGFGFWNDPFSLGLGIGGAAARLPALPNAAWFFHASPPNYLTLHDTHPAHGFLMGTFRSPLIPSAMFLPGLPGVPLLAWPPAARCLRRMAAGLIGEDAARLALDCTSWHHYSLDWQKETVTFGVDGQVAFQTSCSPGGRLGLVIWIDNQFAAFPPDGRLRSGTLPAAQESWLEIQFPE